MNDIVINVIKKSQKFVEVQPKELAERDYERQLAEEQVALDVLIPSQEDVLNAEIELKILNTLLELGVI